MSRIARATQAPGMGLLKLLFTVIYFFQKMTSNGEGISKMPIADQLKAPTAEGGFALPAEKMGQFNMDTSLGWYIKALLGPIVDNLPIFGYRRKSWLILTCLLTTVAWAWVALFGQSSVGLLFIGILFVNIFVAMGDVITDGMMLEWSKRIDREQRQTDGTTARVFQSAQWAGAMAAITIGALGGGIIAQFFNLRWAAIISGVLPMILILLIALAVEEEKVEWDWAKAKKGLTSIWIVAVVALTFVAFSRAELTGVLPIIMPIVKLSIVVGAMALVVKIPKELIVPAVFMITWFMVPFNLDGPAFISYFTEHSQEFLNKLRSSEGATGMLWNTLVTLKVLTAEELAQKLADGNGLADLYYGSVLGGFGALGGIFGAVLFGTRFKGTPMHRVLYGAIIVQIVAVVTFWVMLADMTPVGLMAFAFVGTAMSLIVLLGALSYAAQILPDRDHATLYAFLMSMTNIGMQYGIGIIGGGVYDAAGGKQVVTDAAGEQAVVMESANSGIIGILVVSLIFLAGIALLVRGMHRRHLLDMVVED